MYNFSFQKESKANIDFTQMHQWSNAIHQWTVICLNVLTGHFVAMPDI